MSRTLNVYSRSRKYLAKQCLSDTEYPAPTVITVTSYFVIVVAGIRLQFILAH